MIVSKNVRDLALCAHVVSSVGWFGAIAAFLVFTVKGQSADDTNAVTACAEDLRLIGWGLVVPFCIAGLMSGILQSVVIRWGLLSHYWVVLKLMLMVGATALLFLHMDAVDRLAVDASTLGIPGSSRVFSSLKFDAIVALVLVAILSAISIYKPTGRVLNPGE